MSAQEIDWSQAPIDATHHTAETNSRHACWIKPGYAVRVSRGASGWVRNDYADGFIADGIATKRQSNWCLGALPPEGTVCEIAASTEYLSISYPEGAKVKVYANFTDDRGVKLAAFIDAAGKVGGVATGKCFRPIRTPEQIAADDREAAIDEMKKSFDSVSDLLVPTSNTYLNILFGAMYGDGYRKPSEHRS
jgi:hypothetical protein